MRKACKNCTYTHLWKKLITVVKSQFCKLGNLMRYIVSHKKVSGLISTLLFMMHTNERICGGSVYICVDIPRTYRYWDN